MNLWANTPIILLFFSASLISFTDLSCNSNRNNHPGKRTVFLMEELVIFWDFFLYQFFAHLHHSKEEKIHFHHLLMMKKYVLNFYLFHITLFYSYYINNYAKRVCCLIRYFSFYNFLSYYRLVKKFVFHCPIILHFFLPTLFQQL